MAQPPLPLAESPPLRRNRTFWLVLSGNTVSTVGDGFHSLALSLWILQTTGSARAMAAVLAVRVIVGIALGSVGGTVADRADRRRLMWGMDLLRATLVLGIAWLVRTPGSPFAAVLGLTALLAAAGEFRGPAGSASMVHIVGREHVQRAASLSQISNTFAELIGPLLGGAVAAAFGGWAALLGDAGSFLLCALAVLAAGPFPSPRRGTAGRQSFWQDLGGGLTFIRRNPIALAACIFMPSLNVFANAVGVLLPVLIVKVWHSSALQFGALEAAVPMGVTLASSTVLALGARLRHRGWLVLGAGATVGPIMIAFGLSGGFWSALPLMFAVGVTSGLGSLLLSVAMQAEVSPDMQGRVFGTLGALSQVASPIGLAVAGLFSDAYGPVPVMIAFGVGALLAGGVDVVTLRGLRAWQ